MSGQPTDVTRLRVEIAPFLNAGERAEVLRAAAEIEALRAAAPGSDPAPKVGDRVRLGGSDAVGILEKITRKGHVRTSDDDLIPWPMGSLAPAPVGVSETEGDQPDDRGSEWSVGECDGCSRWVSCRPLQHADDFRTFECEDCTPRPAGSDQDGERR